MNKLFKLFLLTGLIFCLIPILSTEQTGLVRAEETVEVIYKWIKPATRTEQKFYQALIEKYGAGKGSYYYQVFAACQEDTLLNKSGQAGQTRIKEVLRNGRRINLKRYGQMVKSGQYQAMHYQNTPSGLLHLGRQNGAGEFILDLKLVPILPSRIPIGGWYTSPYLLGGTMVLMSGSGSGGGGSSGSAAPTPTAPNASFTALPTNGTVATTFNVNASGCTDAEDPLSSLQVRWDWEKFVRENSK